MSDQAERVEALFLQANELTQLEREALLAAREEEDPEVVAEVRAMFDVPEDALGRLFATSGRDASGEPVARRDEAAGDSLGPYRLIEEVGEGGFGKVWRAEQVRPVRRSVAVKVLKAGMDTKQVLARFEAERNALSLMNHSNIARVNDAGTAPSGRPYFVMELVEGIPITEFCDQEELSISARLELFLDVCGAVQHAHQKGVIHRDLKPANILVTMREGKPVPKVIDFGIAKATSQSLSEGTIFTLQGQLMGTPEYMSPEQAEMSGIGVDSTTDIYALGVLLYELLTGVLPFDPKTLRSRGMAEIHRILREEEPPKPSTRISTLGPDTQAIGRRRRVDSRRLRSELAGDLDWIVMRAMEKQRTRRYPSASELAADVRRHLEDEPVLAGPPSAGYRLGKFVKRHRGSVVFSVALLLVLLGGIASTSRGMWLADQERIRAEESRMIAEASEESARLLRIEAEEQRALALEQKALAEASLEDAEAESDRARAVTDFLLDTLGLANPDVTELPELTMADALEAAAAEVGTAFADYPENEAELRLVLGRAYFTLGRPDRARNELRRALYLQRSVLHGDIRDERDVLRVLWQVENRLGNVEWQPLAYRTRDLTLQLLARTHPELADGLRDVNARAMSLFEAEAEVRRDWDALCESARLSIPTGSEVYDDFLMAAAAAPLMMGWRSQTDDAARMLESLLEKDGARLSNSGTRVLTEQAVHFRILIGDFDRARALLAERVAHLADILGPDHWYLAIYRYFDAQCLVAEGREEEARRELEAVLETLDDSVAPRLWESSVVRQALAELYEGAGRMEDAAPLREELLDEMLAHPLPMVWPTARRALAPRFGDLLEAIEDFDRVVRRYKPGKGREEKVQESAEALLDARRRLAPDEDPAAAFFGAQVAVRAQALLGVKALTPSAVELIRDSLEIARHHPDRFVNCQLDSIALLRVHFEAAGSEDELRALSLELDARCAELLVGTDWRGVGSDSLAWTLLELARSPGLSPATYLSLDELAAEIFGHAPDQGNTARARGALAYRLGRHADCVVLLLESERLAELAVSTLNESEIGLETATLEAFLAMAHAQLGDRSAATSRLERARALAQELDGGPSAWRFTVGLAEAETCVAGDD